MTKIVDGSKATVHAGPVSRAAGVAYSLARLLPLSNRILIDVNSQRPVDSALSFLSARWRTQHAGIRQVVITPRVRDSWRHSWHLGRSRWLVTNELFFSRLPKREGQFMLVAVNEQPLVRSGRDNPDWVLQPSSERRPSRSQVDRWDLVVTSSPFATQVLRSSSGYVGEVLEGVSAFADASATALDDPQLRIRLALNPNLPVVLCALASSTSAMQAEALVQAFAGRMQFRFVTDDGSRVHSSQVFDDLPSWCAAADLLVTDWSSLAMEFGSLQRPIVAFQPDHLDVVRRRGTYLDLPTVLPGPMVTTMSELFEQLQVWLADGDAGLSEFGKRSSAFSQFGAPPKSVAAERIWQSSMGSR
ncbi:MAG: CDP-glycerol glycerophosphotransferase family protein [Actinomycetota bacterium]|nr:CDP-glycerol glycerophosphotransferase family protein [Actinomycetota bacterium]